MSVIILTILLLFLYNIKVKYQCYKVRKQHPTTGLQKPIPTFIGKNVVNATLRV